MALSRAELFSWQESGPAMTDAQRIEHLQEMRKEQLRLARSWKLAEERDGKPTGWEMHLHSARSLHNEIKALQLQVAYAKIDQIMGDEPIKQTDYDDLAETIKKEDQ